MKLVRVSKLIKVQAASVLSAVLLLCTSGAVFAAGSLVVSVEPASGTFQTGSINSLNLYGTTSGANTSGFSFTVTLVNMTINSFDATGNPFSLDSISSGGTAGSTTVSITVGYSSPTGGSGKQFVGKLQVTASDTASTATAKITAIDAYDSDLNPMSGTAANGTYTIVKPATPPPATPTPTPTKTTTSTVTIPTKTTTTTVGDSKPSNVPESTVAEVVNTQGPDVPAAQVPIATTTQKKRFPFVYVIAGLALVAAAIAALKIVQTINKRRSYKSNYSASYIEASTPQLDIPTQDSQTILPSDSGEQSAPKIINPDHIDKPDTN